MGSTLSVVTGDDWWQLMAVLSTVVMRMGVAPTGHKKDGGAAAHATLRMSDTHGADLRRIPEALAGIVSLWLPVERKKGSLEVGKEPRRQWAHRFGDVGSALLHAGNATVRMKAQLTQ